MIKEILELNQLIKQLSIKTPGRKPKRINTVHINGYLVDLLARTVIAPKYDDPGSPLITVTVNGVAIPNTLVDLGAAINVMTVDVMEKLGLTDLHPTITVLQMVNQSIAIPKGIIENTLVKVDGWEYLADFQIIESLTHKDSYLIILGRPWLVMVAVKIDYREGGMIISHGTKSKQLFLYPPTKPAEYRKVWVDEP